MNKQHSFIKNVLNNIPNGWLKLTTHRLDIYNESLAKIEFLEKFEALKNITEPTRLKTELENLPTAYDYIRLGHPLSCVLEWFIASKLNLSHQNVISFASTNMAIFSILRKNKLSNNNTNIVSKQLPTSFDEKTLKEVYGYQFDLNNEESDDLSIEVITMGQIIESKRETDFTLGFDEKLGSIIICNSSRSTDYIGDIQHVRRRESIAMTPVDCFNSLKKLILNETYLTSDTSSETLTKELQSITNTKGEILFASSGLSMQYAITLGLIENAFQTYPDKKIKIIVPPNCYGGTNDQARRVAASIRNVEVLDLPVDSGNDMVSSIDKILDEVASYSGVPLIIAEIPTNPRVEVPNLENLKEVLTKKRENAIDPVFILDQTFCPNFHFLGENDSLAEVQTISYVSGSKFPSGGMCTSGYCVANKKAEQFITTIKKHLILCDNQATNFQLETLTEQVPSMLGRITDAYKNTRAFVDHIEQTLPDAKINFVSNELAEMGFTPSVFSLDLPTKGSTHEEKEAFKREMNLKLINMMILEIPSESKFAVSYGQQKGCYWTIPATSTQGTTKEKDKDYIVRVSISPNFDLDAHKSVFTTFCNKYMKSL